MRMSRRHAFTMIELITVMAITAILMSIIIVPMIQSFAATRTAQAFADAQDKARILTERITREISDAVAVRDTDGIAGRVAIVVPIPTQGVDDAGVAVTTPGGYQTIAMNFTKLDIVPPARVGTRVGNAYIDPNTGKVDPTIRAPKGQIRLPLAPGITVKRFWIGLRDPFANYSNPYDGLLMARSGGRDNLFVLYSAEVEPIIMDATNTPVVNTEFFDATDATNRTPIYDDPNFFLPTGASLGAPVNNDAKATRVRNWLKRAQIVTELSRYDMIQPVYDRASRLVKMFNVSGVYVPRISPLISFRPSSVTGESTEAQVASPLGQEGEGGTAIGSELFQTQFGMWSSYNVRTYGAGWIPGNGYQIARKDGNSSNDLRLYYIDPTLGVADTTPFSGTELFNISAYEQAQKTRSYVPASRYPFSVALNGLAWTAGANAQLFNTFMPFSTAPTSGKVIASFAIAEVGNAAGTQQVFDAADLNNSNLPQSLVGTALTPSNDPAVATGTFSDAPFWNTTFNRWDINRVFNKVWADAQTNQNGIPAQFGETGGAHRFLDLRVTPQGDGTPSPLGLFPRASVVPGTDEVFGPDQAPGPNFGYEILYRRVNKEPGPNEYRINYSNLPEPNAAGWALLGLPVPPANYDRTNFVSAVVQPRYRAGYIQLCSNPEVPIPDTMRIRTGINGNTLVDVPGRIRVAYKFQFTTAQDVVKVEYDTRQLISVMVTIRNYPQSTTPNPQTVSMKATANVRNYLR